MIAVKAICDNDTRRFSIDPALKFAGLKDEILTRFGLSADNLKLKFKDDEGGTSQRFPAVCLIFLELSIRPRDWSG